MSSVLRNLLTNTSTTVGALFAQNPTMHNFSPRFGFAWDVWGNGKTAVRGGAALLYDISNTQTIASSLIKSQPPFSSTLSVTSTASNPLNFTLPISFAGAAGSTTLWSTDYYNFQQPRLYSENLTVEQQLTSSMVLAVSYAGSRGIHLTGVGEGNPNVAQIQSNGTLFWPANPVRVNPSFSTNTVTFSHKDSVFHALEVSLTKRMTKGLQFQSNYTWAKSIDNAQASISDCTASSGMASNPYNSRFDRSVSCFSAPHTWVSNFLYTLPSLNIQQQVLGSLTSGWGISGIFTAHSGFPFNVWESVERARTGVFGGAANPPIDRPNWNPSFTGPVILGKPDQFYNPNAFVLQPAGTLGNVGRDSLRGPGFAQLDFVLRKDTKLRVLGEAGNLEFRAEFFNIFNHPNFNEPNGAVFAGTLTNVTEAPLSTAGQILSTVQPSRQIEFALKLVF